MESADAVPVPASRRARLGSRLSVVLTVLSRVGTKGLSFLFIILLARLVTPAEFAAYSYLVTLALTGYLLTEFGVATIAGREVARDDLDLASAYRAAILPATVQGILGALFVAVVGLAGDAPGADGLPLFFAAVYVFGSAYLTLQSDLLRGAGRQRLEAVLFTIGNVAFVVIGASVVIAGLGLTALMAAFAGKQFVMGAVTQVFLPSPTSGRHVPGATWRLLRSGLFVGLASTFLALSARAGFIVLGNLGTVGNVADYAVASRVYELEIMIAQTLGFAVLPMLADRHSHDPVRAAASAVRLWLRVVLAAVAAAAVSIAVMPWLLPFVFGDEYRSAVRPSQILAAAAPAAAGYLLAWYALAAARRERAVLVAATAGAVVSAAACVAIVVEPTAVVTAIATPTGVVVSFVLTAVTLFRLRSRETAPGD